MSNKTGRPKGLGNLSDERRALILARKNSQFFSHNHIAQMEGISRRTVVSITPESVSPKVLELAQKKSKDVADEIARVRDKALCEIEKHLDNGTMPPSTLPATFGVLFDKYRLQTDQSTSNVSVQGYAQILAKWITEHAPEPELITRKIDAICDAQGLTNAQAQELRDAVIVGKC